MNLLKYRDMAYGNPKGCLLWNLVRGEMGTEFASRLRRVLSPLARVPREDIFVENFFYPLVSLMVYEFGIDCTRDERLVALGVRQSMADEELISVYELGRSLVGGWPIEVMEVDKWLDLMIVRDSSN